MLGRALSALVIAGVVTGCADDATAPLEPVETTVAANRGVPAHAHVNRDLSQLRRVTAPFHNFEKAEEAGYGTQATVCWFHSGLGAMGYHYLNPALIDLEAELLEPELLVYEPRPDGSLRLVAMEYIVPKAAWDDSGRPGLPSVAGQEFHDNGAGLYILHIWAWLHNPSGIFADWNPKASCEHAAESLDLAQ